jgi:hypothetical protein
MVVLPTMMATMTPASISFLMKKRMTTMVVADVNAVRTDTRVRQFVRDLRHDIPATIVLAFIAEKELSVNLIGKDFNDNVGVEL